MCRFRGRRQAHYFVNLHVQISWQAQHFVNLHASPNLDGEAPRNDGCEVVSGHARIILDHARNRPSIVIRGFSVFVSGAALCEPPCADFVAGALLCEPPCADFVAGTALCEPPCFSEPRRGSSAERRLRDGLGSRSGHSRNRPSIAIRGFSGFLKRRFRGRRSTL